MKKAAVFEKTYRDYLNRLAAADYLANADRLGAEISGKELIIVFCASPYRISAAGITDAAGKKANFAVSIVLCNYVLRCPKETPADGDWVTYREFRDAAPLIGYFTRNTRKLIESTFAGGRNALEAACRKLGAISFDDGASYDLSMKFSALPRIPVRLNFNDRDEEFPAQATFLFKQSAENYLDMETLAIAGTFLAGRLVKPNG